jgi:enoyl-CoA hydratase
MEIRKTVEYKNITLEREEAVAIITINRPDKLNALSRDTMAELDAAATALSNDPGVRAVVVTGAGDRAFVAGADINELATIESASAATDQAAWGQAILDRFEQMPKPVIAAINGYALGGGCELALACDIRVAGESARLGQPEINLGIIPGYGGTQRLPRLVGHGMARYLIFSGDHISAQDAKAIGLVDMVVPDGELRQRVMELAHKLAAKAPIAIATAKRAINVGSQTDLASGLAFEAAQFGLTAVTEDAKEGLGAFLEKRKPAFKGR